MKKPYILVLILAAVMISCAPKNRSRLLQKGVVQPESPVPVKPEGPLPPGYASFYDIKHNIDKSRLGTGMKKYPDLNIPVELSSYQTMRVRVFPILSAPSGDPYPTSKNKHTVSFYNSSGFEVYDPQTWHVLGEFNKITMMSDKSLLYMDNQVTPLATVYLKRKNENVTTTVKWNDGDVKLEYRGDFLLEKTGYENYKSKTGQYPRDSIYWAAINYVSVEDYLLSVVPSEMPSSFGLEALKAQAVAARTYALFHAWYARNVHQRNWDVDPTTWYQSYRGSLVEIPKTVSPAVRATEGQLMLNSSNVIEAFFSANSGGVLCTVEDCFDMPDRDYIQTKKDAEGIRNKPGGKWDSIISAQGIDSRLKKLDSEGKIDLDTMIPDYSGSKDIKNVSIYDLTQSQRIKRLQLNLKDGRKIILNRFVSRQMKSQFKFKTQFYEIGNGQNVNGYGFGHGVGMSQWGAHLLAAAGTLYDQILSFYYKDISLQDF